MYFYHLGVFLTSVKTLTTEITENKTTPKFCKITVHGTFAPGIRIRLAKLSADVYVVDQASCLRPSS